MNKILYACLFMLFVCANALVWIAIEDNHRTYQIETQTRLDNLQEQINAQAKEIRLLKQDVYNLQYGYEFGSSGVK